MCWVFYNGVDTFLVWNVLVACSSSLKKILLLIELCYRASPELLGEVVVGEEPVGRRSVELIRTKRQQQTQLARYTIGCCRRIGSLRTNKNNLYQQQKQVRQNLR